MDLTFVGPIIGGLLALGGTSYLAFSANKRESIASAERQLEAWYKITRKQSRRTETLQTMSPEPSTSFRDIPPDYTEFIAQAPFLWGDDEALHIHNQLSEFYQGRLLMEDEAANEKHRKLLETATQRIAQFRRIIEDMRRRSAWTFVRAEYISRPADYTFRVVK
ncbi:MAG: hypothetical protein E6K08_09970 [Methanobacteriota archaeon]|nr:MAG: hypothetical protein E6K08_09970 [Euryarchaeota archaeon]